MTSCVKAEKYLNKAAVFKILQSLEEIGPAQKHTLTHTHIENVPQYN